MTNCEPYGIVEIPNMFGGKIMKKILAILLAMLVMLSFAACGSDTNDDYEDDGQNIDANNNANNNANNDANDADVCHECGNELSDDDEGWMSSVYDEDGNMIDVYICDACWDAESNGDADAGASDDDSDADVDAGATADVDAGATSNADTTAGGGYDRVPQNSLNNVHEDEGTFTCCECGKKMTYDEASIVATSEGDKEYYCSDCYEDWLNS